MFVRRLATTIVRKVADGGLIVDSETGIDCVVNPTGLLFINFIKNRPQCIDTIVPQLQTYFEDVEIEELKKDFTEFVLQMAEKHFVEVSDNREDIDVNTLETLHLDITQECNERCIHCYLPNSLKDKSKRIPLDKFYQIIDELVEMGGKKVILSGGEPLMHPSIKLMMQYCGQKGLETTMFSNLLLLNEDIIKIMKSSNVRFVQTSVYSLSPTIHDSITKRKGSLEKTLSAIDCLLDNGIDVQVACPIMKQNQDGIERMMEYAQKKHIKLRANCIITPKSDGDDSFVIKHSLTYNQKRDFVCKMMEHDERYTKGTLLELNHYDEDFYNEPKHFLNSSLCCAGVSSCAISPSGDVFPCVEWQSYKLGNIYEQSLSEIWYDSPSAHLLREINKQSSFKRCLECEALDYCKRCLMQNETSNNGELLRINKQNCEYAWMLKSIVEKYKEKEL